MRMSKRTKPRWPCCTPPTCAEGARLRVARRSGRGEIRTDRTPRLRQRLWRARLSPVRTVGTAPRPAHRKPSPPAATITLPGGSLLERAQRASPPPRRPSRRAAARAGWRQRRRGRSRCRRPRCRAGRAVARQTCGSTRRWRCSAVRDAWTHGRSAEACGPARAADDTAISSHEPQRLP